MSAYREHVQYQLLNEHSWVGLLLDAIQCSDAGLQAALVGIKTNNGSNSMRNNFEETVAIFCPMTLWLISG